MKHTPAPWNVIVLHDVEYKPGATDSVYMLDPNKHDMEYAEAEANVSLIAAAPELLEACKQALSHLDGIVWNQAKLRYLRDAIAKAEGKR